MKKEDYTLLAGRLPVFFQPWWLDCVCEEGEWCAESYPEQGEPKSVFVYFMKKKHGIKYIVMPQLTQFLGEYALADNSLNDCKLISNYFIDSMPQNAFMALNMSHNFKYWSPYLWRGFKQTTRYSLTINDLSDIDMVFNNFDESKKRNVRKADKQLEIRQKMTGEEFYDFFAANQKSKNAEVLFSRSLFLKLHKACTENNAGTILQAVDSQFVKYGALFVVWDKTTMYALTYSFSDKYRNSGVGDYLMFTAMKMAAQMNLAFDFEGSMIENVEQSYRRFGAKPVEYYQISKISNPLLRIVHQFRPLF